MDIELSTPALLFPAISLLMLAYTNRFLGLAGVIRELHHQHENNPDLRLLQQINNLRRRLRLIRDMQACGVLSLLLCMICMILLLAGYMLAGKVIFSVSLLLMVISLTLSLWEVHISTGALDIHLQNLEKVENS